jgi:hypothetical protein
VTKIPNVNNLREERFILVHSSSPSWWGGAEKFASQQPGSREKGI